MAASQVVFDTYELREKIIVSLPVRKIYQLKRVSKTWLKHIQDSRIVRIAAISVPITTDLIVEGRNTHGGDIIPDVLVYGHESRLEPDTLLKQAKRTAPHYRRDNDSIKVREVYYLLDTIDRARLSMFPSDYVTRPPCQALTIHLRLPGKRIATIYAKEGVRLGHLAEVVAAVERQERQRELFVTLWLYVSIAEVVD
ncbi:hypothetical protein LTR37_004362 [Vermiconidia calcicola]|uniref:Uncharacterized protein n=1 Tax=Vermiconidia calcicola TaxID=1690605 RepID=A0ACC3NM69_9PEZI|nr:hypothetical protein LTR37_004362 [Vermiconidia calcicola]